MFSNSDFNNQGYNSPYYPSVSSFQDSSGPSVDTESSTMTFPYSTEPYSEESQGLSPHPSSSSGNLGLQNLNIEQYTHTLPYPTEPYSEESQDVGRHPSGSPGNLGLQNLNIEQYTHTLPYPTEPYSEESQGLSPHSSGSPGNLGLQNLNIEQYTHTLPYPTEPYSEVLDSQGEENTLGNPEVREAGSKKRKGVLEERNPYTTAAKKAHQMYFNRLNNNHVGISAPNPIDPEGRLLVTGNAVYFTAGKKIGQGGMSSVYRSRKLKRGQGSFRKEKEVVLKDAKGNSGKGLEREFRFVKEHTNREELKNHTFNFPKTVFRTEDGVIGEYRPCKGDLKSVQYDKLPNPVGYTVTLLKDYVQGMRILAEKNLVHRDIKGPNLLVSENDRGCIGDFGLIDEHKGGVQGTTLTPTYAAPFIWKNILDQRERKGHQGEAADVYALGVTMQYDILRPMIQQLAKEQQVDLSEFNKALNPTRVYTGPFTNDQLLEIEEEARSKGERAVYLAAVNNGQPKVVIYPSPERVFAATMEAIGVLEKTLPNAEYLKIVQLAKLAFGILRSSEDALSFALLDEQLKSL